MLPLRTTGSAWLVALVLSACGRPEPSGSQATPASAPSADAPPQGRDPQGSPAPEREIELRWDSDPGALGRTSSTGDGHGPDGPPPAPVPELDLGPPGESPGPTGSGGPLPPTAAPSVSPDLPAKPREITVYYGTNRALLALDAWAYLRIFRWAALAFVGTLVLTWILRRALKPTWRPWSLVVLIGGLGLSIWYGTQCAAEALRLRQYAARVGRVHANAILDGTDWPLETGVCQVAFHRDHKPGRLERPELTHFEIFEDPSRHVLVRTVEPIERAAFFARLGADLRGAGADEAFVFVHGYNTTFEEAVLRTGQIAFDLGFPGLPICFSWASYGGLESYLPDEGQARTSALHLRRFLEDVVSRAHPARLHLVVHSMGARVAYDALRDARPPSALADFHFDEVVLAAPDIGVDEFRTSALPRLLGCCGTATLYASDADAALKISEKAHHMRRAGQAGGSLVVDRALETIDVTLATRGHSYIGADGRVLKDLGALLIERRRAGERPQLEPRSWVPGPGADPLPYWVLRPERR